MFSDHLYLAMDINPSGPENTDQMIIWPDDFAQNFQASRSYRCTFCKRGFSNAQALGGHMNIHRKDRAKLREFSCENLLSLDITKTTDCEDEPDHIPGNLINSAGEKLSSLENQTKKMEFPDDDHDLHEGNHDDIVEENLVRSRLPLFDEAPSSGNCCSHFDKHVESTKVELISHGELDLELRLGPEPNVSKSKP